MTSGSGASRPPRLSKRDRAALDAMASYLSALHALLDWAPVTVVPRREAAGTRQRQKKRSKYTRGVTHAASPRDTHHQEPSS